MKKADIEQIVRELFRENFNLYPDSYPLTETGLMTEEGTINAQEVALGYFRERSESEIFRDEELDVTKIDYVNWVMAELEALVPEAK